MATNVAQSEVEVNQVHSLLQVCLLQFITVYYSLLQFITVHYSLLQFITVYYSLLQDRSTKSYTALKLCTDSVSGV